MKTELMPRRRLVALGLLTLAGLAAVVWAIAVPRPALYVVGLLLCAPLVVLATAAGLRRWTARRLVLWPAGVLVVLAALVAAIAVPRAALAAQTRSDVRWATSLDVPLPMSTPISVWSIGDRVYLLSAQQPLQAYDKAGGQVVAEFPAARYGATAVAADGSVVGWDGDAGEVTHYSPDGAELWSRPFRGRGAIGTLDKPTPVVAVADGVVVLADCRVQLPAKPCRWTGVDKSGKTVWEQQDDRAAEINPGLADIGRRTVAPLPSVVLGRDGTGSTAEYVVRAAADGRELGRHAARPLTSLGIQGDLVVIAERTEDGCRLVGLRDGRQVLATQGMTCLKGMNAEVPGRLRLTPGRAYLEQDGNARTVSLKDGSWRAVSGLTFSTGDEPAVAGSDVLVYRNGSELSAVDAGTGERLWKKSAPGEVVAVYVDNGGLLVFSEPRIHNPFLSRADQTGEAIQASSWVARTGERTGSLLIRNGDATRGASVGPGQALLVGYCTPDVRLVGSA
ncbi:PQQ-binding-like beta-propeller repeat protein [Kribbella lupini]|uniref:Pyrrolo-quinoline quinone repeat domain-containing protein n=1 Tax=Kribbella lupini TaxID=291602 RepID=A0ABP4NJI2_9ACTN